VVTVQLRIKRILVVFYGGMKWPGREVNQAWSGQDVKLTGHKVARTWS